MTDLLKTILLGLIEGVTEFLPVSSTGHMILFDQLTGQDTNAGFWSTFIVVIQIGAIAAVAVYFRERLVNLVMNRREVGSTPLEMLSRRSSAVGATAGRPGYVAAGSAAVASESSDGHGVTAGTPGDLTHAPTAPHVAPHAATPATPPVLTHPGTKFSPRHPLVNIFLATLPALVIGYLVHGYIEENLESPLVVAWALGVGGVLMLIAEWFRPEVTTPAVEDISRGQALGIGFAQVLAAIFPGTSRSAATILGGLGLGLSRPAAAEFSFFIAIPVMCCACGYKLLKWLKDAPVVTGREVAMLAVGTLISFLVAWVVIAAFMGYIRKYTFVPFAVYRLFASAAVFALIYLGPKAAPVPPAPQAALDAPAVAAPAVP